MKFSNVDICYALCNRYDWFTCGSNDQYEKMFLLARNGKLHEVAVAIWLCSDNVSVETVEELLTEAGFEKVGE